MAKATTTIAGSLCLCLSLLGVVAMAATYSVADYGAESDGQADSTEAFLAAWSSACAAAEPATIYVPAGRFLVGSDTTFRGPCKNSAITIQVNRNGTLVAPAGYTSAGNWLLFKYVDGLTIHGGTIDGRGQAFWECKMAGRSCPEGATSLSVYKSKNVLIRGLTSLDSEMFHISIFGSNRVKVQGARIIAPGDSPNTDGIHVQMSTDVTILNATIKTGDDCISMGQGADGVRIKKVNCGPGHGISIGSLGQSASVVGVQNITVKSVFLSGTQNGLRIKTWARPSSGFVRGVTFAHAVMQDVSYPIVIDQNYCPGNVDCPRESSGVKISGVSYSDIQGSSATRVAVKFDCSASNPCSGLSLSDINLTFNKKEAQAYCKNAEGSTSGTINPPSCF